MSTQTRSGGGGGGGNRTQKKSNSGNSGGSGNHHHDAAGSHQTAAATEKKQQQTEKPEKAQPKATTEQLRIAQITNSTTEDPQINEKVTLLLTMTQRSEEEVCCALNECDYDLEAAANFLIEILPQGAFAKYEKKRKNKASNASGTDGTVGDGDWADGNANAADRREKSRNRSANRGGRGGTDSRGWRGREARENDRNNRESRGGGNTGERIDERTNDNYRGQRNGGRSGLGGGGRGGGYVSRSGRGGGRMGVRSGGPRGERSGGSGGGYGVGSGGRSGGISNEDHHEVELWDNTIAQNAEKQQQSHDDAWGDWNNEEYEGSLKDSKVFTTSNLVTQTTGSVVSGELSAPPGLESSSALEDGSGPSAVQPTSALSGSTTTPLLQYSAAVSNPPPQLQPNQSTQNSSSAAGVAASTSSSSSPFVSTASDTFSSAASAAATLVQQAQLQQQQQHQQATPIKPSATLSVEQSQYFNSLSSQGGSPGASVAQNAAYANVFASAPGTAQDPNQQQPQVRRARVKLPPPSKIPSSAVEMPGDNALNNIGYLDVQFGGLDFGPDDSFDAIPEKFSGVAVGGVGGIESQQQPVQVDDYQSKSQQQQSALAAGLQTSQILQGDALSSAGYATRASSQQQQSSGSSVNSGSSALDQLTKNDPYGQVTGGNGGAVAAAAAVYQNVYQASSVNKANNAYQSAAQGVGYNSSSYTNVQSSVANSYQPQGYASYQPNAVNSYQQQQQQQTSSGGTVSVSGVAGSGGSATQNIPVGVGSGNQNNSSANANSAYLTSGYSTPQSAYQSSQSVYGSAGLSNSSGFAGSASNSSSQYGNFSASAKLKDATTAGGGTHYDSVSTSSGVSSSSGSTGNGAGGIASSTTGANQAVVSNTNNNVSGSSTTSSVAAGGNNSQVGVGVSQSGVASSMTGVSTGVVGVTGSSTVGVGVGVGSNNNTNSSAVAQTSAGSVAVLASLTNKNSSSSNSSGSGSGVTTAGSAGGGGGNSGAGTGAGSGGGSGGGLVPTNIQMQGYYDLNYTPTSLGAGRDNIGSVAYSTMTDGRFARTDNNSSPVSNVSSTMSQQAGSSAPMLNVPYAYFYGGNVMPGGFQYGTPAIYPQQIPAANTASGGQFPKPSYSAGYGSTNYDTLSQNTQDYSKGGYSSSVNQQSKTQAVSNQPQSGTGSDLTSSMYGKGHVALNKVNSYEKQSFHSGTPPPFNMANTQTAGGTSAQPYGMYLPMPAAGHHNMIHQPIHQVKREDIKYEDQQVQLVYGQMWHKETDEYATNTSGTVTTAGDQINNGGGGIIDNNNIDDFEQTVHRYIQDDVNGISFFAD